PRFADMIGVKAPKLVVHTLLRCLDPAALAVEVPEPSYHRPEPPLEAPDSIEFLWAGETARHVGTIAHAWLQRIAVDGLDSWNDARIEALAPRVARELAHRGVAPAETGK